MSKYVCSVCGYVYDEANGIPESGVAPGTRWEDLPDDWTCPLCGAEKSLFEKHDGSALAAEGTIKTGSCHTSGNAAVFTLGNECALYKSCPRLGKTV